MAAGGSVIGALRVILGIDSAALDTGLKDAQSSFAKFGRDMLAIAGGIKLEKVLTSAFDSVAHAIKESIVRADEFGKAAQKVGMSVEDFSKVAYAADLADVSMEQLAKGLTILNKNFSAVAAGAKGPASQALDAMGLRAGVVNGTIKTQQDLLLAVADKFAGYTDSAQKSALAVAIFGKAGAELIPLLNGGRKAFEDAAEEARRFGIVISAQMANDSQDFNDNLKKLGKITDGLVMQFTGFMVPALQEFSRWLVASAGDGDVMKGASELITRSLIFVAQEIAEVVIRIKGMGDTWVAFQNLLKANAFNWGELKAAWTGLTTVGEELENRINDMRASYTTLAEAIFSQDPWVKQARSYQSMSDQLEGLMRTWDGAKRAAPAFSDAAEKSAAKIEAAYKKLLEAAHKTYEETRTPAEKYRDELAKLEFQYNFTGMSAETFQRKLDMIKFPSLTQAISDAGNLQKQLDDFSTSSLNSTAGALTDIITGAKDAKEAFADLAKAVIRDLVEMTVKAILFKGIIGPMFGFSGGGSLSAGGGGNILGFASGGSFTVPGGMSMTDNHVMPVKVASGERVTVDRPDAASGGSTKTLEIPSIKPREFFRGDTLRAVLENIQLAVNDGYKLKFAG